MAHFPTTRLRRMRAHDWSRRMMRENTLTPDDLVWTMVITDKSESEPVASMPGVTRLTVADAAKAAVEARALGIPRLRFSPILTVPRKTRSAARRTIRTGWSLKPSRQ